MSPKSFVKTTATVDSLIHCAAKYFHNFGYRKTTVDEIASETHISKKTLYSIFSSKEALLREVAWRDTMAIIGKFSDTLPPSVNPDKILLSMCRYIFTDRVKHGKQGDFKGIHIDDNDIRKSYRDALKRVVKEFYDEGSKNGLFKPVDSVFATEVIVNMIITALEHFHKTTEPVRMFNNAMAMIADTIAYKDRIKFDQMA